MRHRIKSLSFALGTACLLSLLLLISPWSLFSQDSSPPSPDFDGNGTVDIPDFLIFVDLFGSKEGEERYDAQYDLDGDGEIGIGDFLIFIDSFGKEVNRAPVFTSEPPVMRSVDENIPSGQPIGDPISATDADGNTLTYRLSGADADRFAIDASTGQITTQGTYNFEEKSSYSVTVIVSDGEGGEASLVVNITINNIEEATATVPSNVVVEEGDSKLTVRWDAVSDEEGKPPVSGYEVGYRERPDASDSPSDEWAGIQKVSSQLNSLIITGLLNGQAYLVSVRTLVDGGMSEWSSPVLGIPVIPAAGPVFIGGGGGGGGTSPPPRPPRPQPPQPPQPPPPTPQVTISVGTTPVTEGTSATFTLTASPAPTSALTVNVNVSETGDVISGTPSSTVTIDANKTSATLTVATDDDADESNSVITAEVESGTGYTVGSTSSASVTVEDNDNPPPSQTSPDLTFIAVVVGSGSSEEGNFVRFVIIIGNVGDGASATSTLRYFRSTDATITTSDTEVTTDAVPELAASESSNHTLDVDPPSNPGTYYYGACVDVVAGESVTSNNCSRGARVVVPGPVARVEVTPREVTLAALGNTATLTARVLDAQGNEISGEAVSWSSVSPEVATVDAAGVVTAVVNGRATVTASASGVSGEATVTVWQRAVSVAIDPGEVELTSVDETAPLTLRAFDANGHEAPGGGDITGIFAWRSADLNVARVSSVGGLTAEVRAIGAGTATVTVTLDDGRLSATATVTVLKSSLQGEGNPEDETPQVTISAGTTPVTEGTAATFTISASPAPTSALTVNVDVDVTYADHLTSGTPPSTVTINANATTATLTVATEDDDVIEINGQVIAEVQTGTGYTVGSSSSARVVIENNDHPTPVASVEIDPSSVEFTEVGATATLTARILDENGNETRATSWGWSSAEEEVATVDNLIGTDVRGWVRAIGAGTTTITLSASGGGGQATGTATVTVTVSGPRVEISPRSLTFEALGETKSVTVKVLDANGDEDTEASFSVIAVFSPCCGFSPENPPGSNRIERVDGGLEITAGVTGSGTVKITSEGATDAILIVKVHQKPASLTLSPSSADLTVGGTAALSAAIADANGYDMGTVDVGDGGKVVYWETSDSAVATVDGVTKGEDGNTGGTATVTAVAAGTVTITGRHSGDITGTATITVTE